MIANGVVFGFGAGESTVQRRADPEPCWRYRRPDRRVGQCRAVHARRPNRQDALVERRRRSTCLIDFSGLSVVNGRVYIGTYDGTLYCFGIAKAMGITTKSLNRARDHFFARGQPSGPGSRRCASGRPPRATHSDAPGSVPTRRSRRRTCRSSAGSGSSGRWSCITSEAVELADAAVLLDRLRWLSRVQGDRRRRRERRTMCTVDDDVAKPLWTAVLNYSADNAIPPSTWSCPGGLMAAATRPTAAAPPAFGGGGGGAGRGGRSGGSVGEPGRGAPNLALAGQGRGGAPGGAPGQPGQPPRAGGGGGGGGGGRGSGAAGDGAHRRVLRDGQRRLRPRVERVEWRGFCFRR